MSTGAEHYREAERLEAAAWTYATESDGPETAALYMAAAQVHATLALAAATAIQPSSYAMPRTFAAHRNEELAWVAVCASTPDGVTEDIGGVKTAMPKGGAL